MQPLVLCGGYPVHRSGQRSRPRVPVQERMHEQCNFLMDVAYRCKNGPRRMQLLPCVPLFLFSCWRAWARICPIRSVSVGRRWLEPTGRRKHDGAGLDRQPVGVL
jgi:hypothetical protein